MAKLINVYDSIIEEIQKQINILENLDIRLSEEEFKTIVNRIGQLNKQLEEYAKRHMR